MPRVAHAKTRAKLTTFGLRDYAPPEGVEIVWDDTLPGFGLRTRGKADMSEWRWVFDYRHRASGLKKRLTLGSPLTHPPEIARKWAKDQGKKANTSDDPWDAQQKARAAADSQKASPTVSRLWDEYWKAEGRLKRSSSRYEELWKLHLKPWFATKKVKDVTPAEVERFKASLAKIPTTANRSLAVLSRMFSKAKQWGYRAGCAPEHPVQGIARYTETPVEFFFKPEELGRLLEAADADANLSGALAIRMLALTGARSKEVMHATWDQIEFADDGRALWTLLSTNTKNARPVVRSLSADLTARLKAWRPASEALQRAPDVVKLRPSGAMWIFPNLANPAEPTNRLWHIWDRIKERAGVIEGRIHDLRHTAATMLARETKSIAAVGAQLGHRSLAMTLKYAHHMREGSASSKTAATSGISLRPLSRMRSQAGSQKASRRRSWGSSRGAAFSAPPRSDPERPSQAEQLEPQAQGPSATSRCSMGMRSASATSSRASLRCATP